MLNSEARNEALNRIQEQIVYQTLKSIHKLTSHLISCLQKQITESHTQQASYLYEAYIAASAAATRTFDSNTAAAHIAVEA